MYDVNNAGYSLLEVLVVLLIISIFSMMVVPFYQHYLIKSRRCAAEQVLMSSALALEHYYQIKHSYEGATLNNLNVDVNAISDYYAVLITDQSPTGYVISAIPTINQKDKTCAILTLNQIGQRGYSGVARSLSNCW